MALITSMISACIASSRFPVGSSARSSAGFLTSALARDARCAGEHGELPFADPQGDVGQRWDLHGPDREHLRYAMKLNHGGHFDYSGPRQILESFSSSRRLTMAGLAFPWVAFMIWPTNAPLAAVLPFL